MTPEQLKQVIRCIHKIWYQTNPSFLRDHRLAMEMHKHMEALFNFADITETLVENNPGKTTMSEFKKMGPKK